MTDEAIEQTERAIRQTASELADDLRQIAEHGTEADSFDPTGIVGARGSEIDRLSGQLALLKRFQQTADAGPGPGHDGPDGSSDSAWEMILKFWPQIRDDLYQWASHRSYSEIMNAAELINSAIEIRDLGMIREAAEMMRDDLKSRTAKKHVRRYMGKAQHLIRLADRAIAEQADTQAAAAQ